MGPFVSSDGVCPGLKRQETEKSASQQACPPDPDPASPRPQWSWALGCEGRLRSSQLFPSDSLSGRKQPLGSEDKKEEVAVATADTHDGLLEQLLLG